MPSAVTRILHGWFHLAVLVVVIAFTIMAVRTRPLTRLIGQAKVNAGTTLSLRDGSDAANIKAPGHRSWDMDLRLDSSIRPPGWPWILHEGKHPGDGYELHWLPERQVLQVQRARPGSFLLGSVRLAESPAQVSFQRRGGQLVVIADGVQVLRCLDPDGPLDDAPRAWGCSTSGTLGDATLTVQAVEPAVPQWGSAGAVAVTDANADRQAADGPFLAVSGALRARGSIEQVAAAFGQAQEQLGANRHHTPEPDAIRQRLDLVQRELGARRGTDARTDSELALTPPDRARLRLWLALAGIRWQLSAGDQGDEATFHLVEEDIDTLFSVTDHDAIIRHSSAAPEIAGILLSLTEPLASRACAIPSAAITDQSELVNDRIFAHRQRWTDLLGRVTARIEALAGNDLAPEDLAQVRLLLHAAGCLRQQDPNPPVPPSDDNWQGVPLPLALDAPAWVAGRWRAFAGSDPGMAVFPPMAGNQGPAANAIAHLADYMDLDPAPAIGLRDLILEHFARRERILPLGRESEPERFRLEDEALRECERTDLPTRERLLARVLVVLSLDGDRQRTLLRPVREALLQSDRVRTDPLAYALDQLLVHRFKDQVAVKLTQYPLLEAFYDLAPAARIARYFPEYQVLMDGTPAANARIWRLRMPYAQALAVALIMQEVAGGQPAWGLLERVPGFTLPLPLLARVRAPVAVDPQVPVDGSVAP